MIVLFGSGYVASKYVKYFTNNNIKFFQTKSLKELDEALWHSRCDGVINAAGYTGTPNVDECETQKAKCIESNVVLPLNIANICEKYSVKMAHVSSGCIYDGYVSGGYTEDDQPNFSFGSGSYYSGSKALAELSLKDKAAYIWRLRIPFDESNITKNYLVKLANYDTLLNMYNSMTYLDEFCSVTVNMLSGGCQPGTYNIVNPSPLNTQEIVEIIKECRPDLKKEFRYFPSIVDFNKIVKAPRSNCVLSVSKLQDTKYGVMMSTTADAVRKVLNTSNLLK